MLVKFNTAKLAHIEWGQYAIRFVLGGTITAIAGLLAEKFGPTVGGLFLAFPAIFPASVTLIEKSERTKKHEKGMHGEKRARAAAAVETYGAALGSIAMACFAGFIWRLLPAHPAALVLPLATVLWTVCAVVIWAILRWHRHRHPRNRQLRSTALTSRPCPGPDPGIKGSL
jgi:Protein of unknown function (DUF3147)